MRRDFEDLKICFSTKRSDQETYFQQLAFLAFFRMRRKEEKLTRKFQHMITDIRAFAGGRPSRSPFFRAAAVEELQLAENRHS
jgi:hypothetical protein